MPNDKNIIGLAVEHLPFVNIPVAVLNFIYQLRPRLSASSILVYLHYWRLWRYGDYKLSIANHDLAEQLGMDVSSIKRSNNQLVKAGLITREVQKRKSTRGIHEHIPSITLPAVPHELAEKFRNTPMRKRYRHEKHGEINSFRELLDVFESEEETIEAPERAVTPVEIRQRIGKLFQDGLVDRNLYTEGAVTRQVTWSIFEGHLKAASFGPDQKRLNIALQFIELGTWTKPKGFPSKYGLNIEPAIR
jgi:hypothetical protein